MTVEENLLPCRVCGRNSIFIHETHSAIRGMVYCPQCGASFMERASRLYDLEQGNTRAKPPLSDLREAANKDILKTTQMEDVDMRVRKPLSDDARQRAVEIIALGGINALRTYRLTLKEVHKGGLGGWDDKKREASCSLAALLEHFDLVER